MITTLLNIFLLLVIILMVLLILGAVLALRIGLKLWRKINKPEGKI